MLSYDERLALKARIDVAVRARSERSVEALLEPQDIFGPGLCEAGCGADIPQPAKHGRPRKYCSKRCANRAFRKRAAGCVVANCGRTGDSGGGACAMHYQRMRQHGSYSRAA